MNNGERTTHNEDIMIYIGFSTHTHRLYARIFCKTFKHCAPVVVIGNKCSLYQFVNKNHIQKININIRDLKILEHYDWTFIKYNSKNAPRNAETIPAITCVQFTKKFCCINKKRILTPDDLFRYLNTK